MARTVRFKGSFEILDAAGKNPEIKQVIDKTKTGSEIAKLLVNIPAGTVDKEIDISGIPQSIATYLNPDSEITVKYEVNTNQGHKVDGPSVEWGTITKIFVSVLGVVPVNLEVVLFGP